MVAVAERDGAAAGAVADRADGLGGDDEQGHRRGTANAHGQGGPLAVAVRGRATGSGKSYLVCALGHQACRAGISTRYYRVSRLLDELTLARGDGSYPKVIQRLARTWLLILDDWGLASLSGQGRHDLLEVLDDRYARRGTLLGSQVPVEHWHDVVGDPTFGDAILDRLLNNAHRITLKGGSMRRLYDSTKKLPGDA